MNGNHVSSVKGGRAMADCWAELQGVTTPLTAGGTEALLTGRPGPHIPSFH